MRRYVYPLSAVMLVLSACGPEELEEATRTAEQAPVGEVSQASLVLTPVPTLIYMPVAQVYQPTQPALLDLSTTRAWPTRFFPSTVKSAYTVYYTFPTIPSTFYAVGFDVKGYKTVFVVRGLGTQKAAFKSEMDANLQALSYEAAMGMNLGYEEGRQVDVPTPPSPTPNIDDLVAHGWSTAKDYYMADVAQPIVYMPSAVVHLQP